jgi:hypothetical protein
MRQDGVFKVPDGSVGLLVRFVELIRLHGGLAFPPWAMIAANRILSGDPTAGFGPCVPLEGGMRLRRTLAPVRRLSFRTVPREHEEVFLPTCHTCRRRAPFTRRAGRVPRYSLIFFRSAPNPC